MRKRSFGSLNLYKTFSTDWLLAATRGVYIGWVILKRSLSTW